MLETYKAGLKRIFESKQDSRREKGYLALILPHLERAEVYLFGQTNESVRTQIVAALIPEIVTALKQDEYFKNDNRFDETFWGIVSIVIEKSLLEGCDASTLYSLLKGRIYFKCLEASKATLHHRGQSAYFNMKDDFVFETLDESALTLKMKTRHWMKQKMLDHEFPESAWEQLVGWAKQEDKKRHYTPFYIRTILPVVMLKFLVGVLLAFRSQYVDEGDSLIAAILFVAQEIFHEPFLLIDFMMILICMHRIYYNIGLRSLSEFVSTQDWDKFKREHEAINSLSRRKSRDVQKPPEAQNNQPSLTEQGRVGLTEAEYYTLTSQIYVRQSQVRPKKEEGKPTLKIENTNEKVQNQKVGQYSCAEQKNYYERIFHLGDRRIIFRLPKKAPHSHEYADSFSKSVITTGSKTGFKRIKNRSDFFKFRPSEKTSIRYHGHERKDKKDPRVTYVELSFYQGKR